MPFRRYLTAGSPDEFPVGTADAGKPRTFTTKQLFQTDSEVWIQHGGETYRLRITKAGKLILNK